MTVTVAALSGYLRNIGHGAWAVVREQNSSTIVVYDQVKGKRASYVYADADHTFRELNRYYVDTYLRRRCAYCNTFADAVGPANCPPCGAPLP